MKLLRWRHDYWHDSNKLNDTQCKTLSMNDTRHNDTEQNDTDCNIITSDEFFLSTMLSVIMLHVIMQNVMAPFHLVEYEKLKHFERKIF
jgi:hypothetical protein